MTFGMSCGAERVNKILQERQPQDVIQRRRNYCCQKSLSSRLYQCYSWNLRKHDDTDLLHPVNHFDDLQLQLFYLCGVNWNFPTPYSMSFEVEARAYGFTPDSLRTGWDSPNLEEDCKACLKLTFGNSCDVSPQVDELVSVIEAPKRKAARYTTR